MKGYRSQSGRFIRWAGLVADARSAGGRWIAAFPDAPASLVRDIRQRRSQYLHHPDGRLVAQARNVYPNDDTGTEYGDIYVRWTTDTEEGPTMPKARHDLNIPEHTAAELDALGAILGLASSKRGRRAPAAAVVLTEYAAGQPRPSIVAPLSTARTAVFVEDEVWEAAVMRAEYEGISIAAVLTEFAPKLLDRERQIKTEGADLT